MKTMGDKLNEIIKMLEEEEKSRRDVVMPINEIRMNEDFTFESDETGRVGLSDFAFGQLCSSAYSYALPADYFRKLYKENPEKATRDINYHLENGRGINRKFRIANNSIKGIVSESYVPYDNLDALTSFLEASRNLPEFELAHSNISEKAMFLRFTFPSTERSLGLTVDGEEDINFVGLDLVNSEVGFSSLLVNPSIYRLVCTNGLIAKSAEYGFYKQRHIHVNPIQLNDNLRKSVVHGVEMGENILDKFTRSREVRIGNPYELITEYGKKKSFSEKLIKNVRNNFDIENERSLYGVVNAFTRTARDIKNIEQRLEMERYASKILDDKLKVVG